MKATVIQKNTALLKYANDHLNFQAFIIFLQ